VSGQILVSIFALVVSLASFAFAWLASRKAAKAEEIKNLLGEKESVAFGALKLLRDGLPGEEEALGLGSLRPFRSRKVREDAKQRQLVIGALMAACLFESSDRARALLFRVIENYRSTRFRSDFDHQYAEFKVTINAMEKYDFEAEEFDPESAEVRLEAVRKVLEHDESAPGKE
jgi:hypothetical protein